jgi:hypothetical protein
MTTIVCGDTSLNSTDRLRWEAERPIAISTQQSTIRFAIEFEFEPDPESLVDLLSAQLDRARRCAEVALDAIRGDYEKGEDSATRLYIEHNMVEFPNIGLQQSISTIAEFMEVKKFWVSAEDDMEAVVDVTLKGDLTNNLIAVHFDEDGAVIKVELES